ncbi:LOW QUALITY PROTEIN: hypothetical protein U9M48_016784 [Paspalum notatum var. saurae]|uniref:Uncharacterized protein n=1 Tax=Paspalum notatum var. saurae TaxID=547442 RepID=A0AAQ3TA82_PASNO
MEIPDKPLAGSEQWKRDFSRRQCNASVWTDLSKVGFHDLVEVALCVRTLTEDGRGLSGTMGLVALGPGSSACDACGLSWMVAAPDCQWLASATGGGTCWRGVVQPGCRLAWQ